MENGREDLIKKYPQMHEGLKRIVIESEEAIQVYKEQARVLLQRIGIFYLPMKEKDGQKIHTRSY